MTRLGYVLATTLVVEAFVSLSVAVALAAPHPRFIWNASASTPVGLYRVTQVAQPKVGQLVVIAPPTGLARYMAERRYLPVGVPMLKHVAAIAGTRVCRRGGQVTIAGKRIAVALARDSHGRRLPVWRGCRTVATGELFLLNEAPDSMDGRYFGSVPIAGVLGQATPIFTRDAGGMSYHWHGLGIAPGGDPALKGGDHA